MVPISGAWVLNGVNRVPKGRNSVQEQAKCVLGRCNHVRDLPKAVQDRHDLVCDWGKVVRDRQKHVHDLRDHEAFLGTPKI